MRKYIVLVLLLATGCKGINRAVDRLTGAPLRGDSGPGNPPAPHVEMVDCCQNPVNMDFGTHLICEELRDAPGHRITETTGDVLQASCMPSSFQ